MCQKINTVEWSGVLLYSVKGSIKNFDTIELTVEDIFPMDKGTAGSTGYELGDEIIDYKMSNPESLSWKMGMIHSHHNMRSYFSGVDMSELSDNTEFHNYYLSLVVNNDKDMVAKVAFRGDIKGYECKNEQGEPWTLKLSKAKQAMFTFDCKIISNVVLTEVSKSFADRTQEIIDQAGKKKHVMAREAKKFVDKPTKDWNRYNKHQKSIQQKNLPPWFEDEEDEDLNDWNQSFVPPTMKNKKDMSEDERYWDFARFLLRFGEDLDGPDTLENALEDISIIVENANAYTGKVITMYPALFEKYWDIFGEINTETFLITTSEVLDILENYEGLFDIVEPLIKGLELMVQKMQVSEYGR